MYEHFEALPPAKRRRILDAAYREFARFGYKKTSAEQIAQSACIAKGMVFHYFGSKKGLFEYLFEYAGKFIMVYFGQLSGHLDKLDYIEQYRLATKTKLQAYTENPYVFEFFTTMFLHAENLEISEKVKQIYDETMAFRSNTFVALQNTEGRSPFREDVDEQKAKRYIAWLLDGYSQSIIAGLNGALLADMDLTPFWEEMDEILDDMKKLFYRQNNT